MCTLLQSIFILLILFFGKEFILSILSFSPNYFTGPQNLVINIIYYFLTLCIPILYFLCNYKNKSNYTNFKNLLLGIITISLYFLLSIFRTPILNCFGITNESSTIAISISSILYLTFTIAIIVLINIVNIKKSYEDIKKYHKKYFSKYVGVWFITLCVVTFINLLLYLLFTKSISGNENLVRNMLKSYPIYSIFSTIVFAPIVEELAFRKSIQNMITNKKIFIVVSGLFFGWLHVAGNINVWSDMLYIIPYSIHGGLFAYFLVKTDNILVPMGFHLLHNGIMTSLQVLLLLLGAL